MSDRIKDTEGTPVSEEDAARDLGFADVFEFRWSTKMDRELAEARRMLCASQEDAKQFRCAGQRMEAVLNKIKDLFENGLVLKLHSVHEDIVKAIDIVCGREADWGGRFRKEGWFGDEEDNPNGAEQS